MLIRKIVAMGCVAVLLGGCTQTVMFRKPGATKEDFSRDSYECERDMRQSAYFPQGLAGAVEREGFGERCMAARGWVVTDRR